MADTTVLILMECFDSSKNADFIKNLTLEGAQVNIPASTSVELWLTGTLPSHVESCKDAPKKILVPVNTVMAPGVVAAFTTAAEKHGKTLSETQRRGPGFLAAFATAAAKHGITLSEARARVNGKPLDICFCPVSDDEGLMKPLEELDSLDGEYDMYDLRGP